MNTGTGATNSRRGSWKVSIKSDERSIADSQAFRGSLFVPVPYGSTLPVEKPFRPNRWRNKHQLPRIIPAYGNKRWHGVQENIKYLLTEEFDDPGGFYVKSRIKKNDRTNDPRVVKYEKKPSKNRRPLKTPQAALYHCTDRYLKYLNIIRQLDEVYKYLVHPQKIRMVRQCIEGAFIRLLEFKNEMVKLECREYQFFEKHLAELHWTPNDVELELPQCFVHQRAEVLKARKFVLDGILDKLFPDRLTDKDLLSIKPSYTAWMTIPEAILLIQKNQRCFIAGRKFEELRLHVLDLRAAKKGQEGAEASEMLRELYRYRVAKWNNFVRRNKRRRLEEDENVYIGLEHETKQIEDPSRKKTDQLLKNRTLAVENEREYLGHMKTLEKTIIETEAPRWSENIKQNILQWALELRDLLGTFPELPTEEEGGSAILFQDKTLEQVEEGIEDYFEQEKIKAKKLADKKAGIEPKGKKEEKVPKKVAQKKKTKAVEEYEWLMEDSKGLSLLEQEETEYTDKWKWKNEADNYLQTHDAEYLKEDVRKNVEANLRREIDELMREELKKLTMAVERQRKIEPKTKKKGGPKGAAKKKGKRKSKDLTANTTVEALYEDLVAMEIIVPPRNEQLSDFIGEEYFSSKMIEESGKEPLPSLPMVKRQLRELAIVPLNSAKIHELAPLVRSMMIAGVRGTGKKTLIHAVCNEAGANLFNLTPSNLDGIEKFQGKKGQQLLMHTVLKVGRAMQPSIFWIDECEKIFPKKKNKKQKQEDKIRPEKYAAILPKTVKKIKNGDRIMLIGTTCKPYLAKKTIFKAFERVVLIPIPDYNSRVLIWSHYIYRRMGRGHAKSIDISSLAKVTNGFTASDIINAVYETITETRLMRMRKKKSTVTAQEFISRLVTFDPVYKEEEAAMYQWYLKTPLMKKRLAMLEAAKLNQS